MIYKEEEFLQLSGIQHFVFCRRQWALIHIEQIWKENMRTTEGNLMHERAHDAFSREKKGDAFIVRGVSIHSPSMGISGQCDVLEYHQNPSGVKLFGVEGTWIPYPVEYKRGSPKENPADQMQLCAQAMCLEEMLCCDVPEGALFYGETRHRTKVFFSEELRENVKETVLEMHQMYQRGHTPRVKPGKFCKACSLQELCLPKLMKSKRVSAYLSAVMEEET